MNAFQKVGSSVVEETFNEGVNQLKFKVFYPVALIGAAIVWRVFFAKHD